MAYPSVAHAETLIMMNNIQACVCHQPPLTVTATAISVQSEASFTAAFIASWVITTELTAAGLS